VSKIRGMRGPVCSPHTEPVLVPELCPPVWWPATIAPSCPWMRTLNRIPSLLPRFACLRLSQYRSSAARDPQLTWYEQLLGNLKVQERQPIKTEWCARRDTRRQPRNRLNEVCSCCPIYVYPTDTRQLTSSQGEAGVWRPAGIWHCRHWGGWISLAVGTA
jgi:hypothetical protein